MASENLFGKGHTPGIESISPFEQMYRERIAWLHSQLDALSAEQKEYLKFHLVRRVEARKLHVEVYRGRGMIQNLVERLVPKIKGRRERREELAEQKLNDHTAETERLKAERFLNEDIPRIEQLAQGIENEVVYDWVGMVQRGEKVPNHYTDIILSRLADSL